MALQLPPNRQPLEGLTAMGKYVITSSLAVSAPKNLSLSTQYMFESRQG